jgi:hypothetical protein
MEGTSTEEGLLMREIEDHPVVTNSCVEKKFKLDTRKYEEYKGVCWER